MRYALTTLRHALFAAVRFNRDAARHVATKTIHAAFMVVSVEGGGIFAKTAKTPPLQSGIVGRTLRGMPHRPSFYARADINGDIIGE